jgi:ABC-2 type transport system permease protein
VFVFLSRALNLTGAALIREREQGTVEHLLVMPVVPAEIMLSKILAIGIVILLAAGLSLVLVVQWWLKVPIAGSILLFLGGSCFYVFTVAALGIFFWPQWRLQWASSGCWRSPCFW